MYTHLVYKIPSRISLYIYRHVDIDIIENMVLQSNHKL